MFLISFLTVWSVIGVVWQLCKLEWKEGCAAPLIFSVLAVLFSLTSMWVSLFMELNK